MKISSLSGALTDRRNQLVRNARFRRWAQRIPGLRHIARKQAASLFELTAGFVNSQVLLACVELELFDQLSAEPVHFETLAGNCGLQPDRMHCLLRAAESLRLVEGRGDGTFGLGVLGSSVQADAGLRGLIRHHRMLYRDLENPVKLLREPSGSTRLGAFWSYAGKDRSPGSGDLQAGSYSRLMGDSQTMVSEQVLQAFDFSAHSGLLDIGGGDGSFLAAVGRRNPRIDLSLFDLPAVTEIAKRKLAESGLENAIAIHSGDFHTDPVPGNQGLISLVRVIHDHDDRPVRALLDKLYQALEPGGTIVIAEPMRDTPGAESMGAAYFGFYLLAMGSGRPRSEREIGLLLRSAGFHQVRRHKTLLPLICSVISARRPLK